MSLRRSPIKTIFLIATALVLIGLALLARPLYRIRAYDAAFAKITAGQTKAEVVALMGHPKLPTQVNWRNAYGIPDPQFHPTTEFRYVVDTHFVPILWLIAFDEEGKVIAKHRAD